MEVVFILLPFFFTFGNMKKIKLTQGKYALVDDEDFWRIVELGSWYAKKDGHTYYAERSIKDINGKKTTFKMHRFIMGITDPKILIDHVDGNGLNNQKSNLRIATRAQNGANRRAKGISKYLGVCIHKQIKEKGYEKYWRAKITINYKQKYLGIFKTEEEAALAYNKAAIEVHGEFTKLNIIE